MVTNRRPKIDMTTSAAWIAVRAWADTLRRGDRFTWEQCSAIGNDPRGEQIARRVAAYLRKNGLEVEAVRGERTYLILTAEEQVVRAGPRQTKKSARQAVREVRTYTMRPEDVPLLSDQAKRLRDFGQLNAARRLGSLQEERRTAKVLMGRPDPLPRLKPNKGEGEGQ